MIKTHDPDFIAFAHRDAVILGDVRQDNMMTALAALAMEVWTMRRRMMVTETVLKQNNVPIDQIESYTPTDTEKAEWARERDQFLKTVFSALGRGTDGEHLTELVAASYEDPAAKAVAQRRVDNSSA